MAITVSRAEFKREVIPDPDPDPSYLDQDEWKERKREYARGWFGFVGVRAAVDVPIPVAGFVGAGVRAPGADSHTIIQRIESPGLWGIESDSGDDYFDEVFRDESAVLADMLTALGVTVTD